ncbi:hypothetical protein EMCRGX_G035003 [Ephydatia muelleri]
MDGKLGVTLSPAWEQFLERKKELQGNSRWTSSRVSAKKSLHFPQPHYSKTDAVLLHSPWTAELRSILRNISGNQISMVTSSAEHQDVLLNWIAAAMLVANPPLENIVVLSLDEVLYNFLRERKIQSLYVSPEMVIDAKIDRVFSQVHIVRLTVLRLINHYGFDVVNYDCDAIVLKNPDPLFEKYKAADMIGTFGKGPSQLFNKWGVTLNTGVLLLRSTTRMEYFWESMSSLKYPTTDDQGNINLVLDELDVKWTNLSPKENIDDIHYDIYGTGRHRLNVVLLSFDVICRHTCNTVYRDSYYVWHALAIKENRTVANKIEQARIGNAWFLRLDWLNIGQNLTGLEWLNSIIIK